MFLRNLKDAQALFASMKRTFVGVGMTAYARMIPSYFIHPYHIICLKKTKDIPLLRETSQIFCLEEETGSPYRREGLNSSNLLAHDRTAGYLKRLAEPSCLLLYQSYPELEGLAKREGWTLLGNPARLRLRMAERSFFKKMVRHLGLPEVPGNIYPLRQLETRSYGDWAASLGPNLVLQLPDIKQGGGKGTFFVRSSSDYEALCGLLKNKAWRGVSLKTISVHRFLEGTPASLALCLTRGGILFTGLQRQLVDLPYCGNLPQDGVFCGHVWGKHTFSKTQEKEARRQGSLIGRYLAQKGYRGILGIDFLIRRNHPWVYPIELNPRFTGLFPMLSLLHIQKGIIPMEVFHMLEFLDTDYRVDLEALNEDYCAPLEGSHLILFLPFTGRGIRPGRLDAGLYQLDSISGGCNYLKGALDFSAIAGERQFVVVDGPSESGSDLLVSSDPLERLCRLLFSQPVATSNGSLSQQAQGAVQWIYRAITKDPA